MHNLSSPVRIWYGRAFALNEGEPNPIDKSPYLYNRTPYCDTILGVPHLPARVIEEPDYLLDALIRKTARPRGDGFIAVSERSRIR